MNLDNLISKAGQIINDPTITANAVIEFQRILTPAGVERDAAGRYVPTAATTETVTLSCYLRQSRRNNAQEKLQLGIDVNAVPFTGRLVDPKTYQFPLRANGAISVTINGRKGTMILDSKHFASPTDEQYDIKGDLGQRISFYVQFKQGE
jgi:hypothetical protein